MPRLLLAAAVSLALFIAAPSSALAAPVECGDVITASTTLEADVRCAPGAAGVLGPDGERYALLIGADGVKLDLAGHGVYGVPQSQASRIHSIGAFGRDRLSISNGRLGEQLTLQAVRNSRLTDLNVYSYLRGILLDRSRSNSLRRVAVQADFIGALELSNGSNRNTVAHSKLSAQEFGLKVDGSHRNRIRHNTIGGYSVGLWLRGSHRTVVRYNDLNAGGSFADGGLVVEAGARHTRVLDNYAHDSYYDGIWVGDPTTRLIRNTATGNGDLGIDAVPGTFGRGNRANGNTNPLQCVGVVCS